MHKHIYELLGFEIDDIDHNLLFRIVENQYLSDLQAVFSAYTQTILLNEHDDLSSYTWNLSYDGFKRDSTPIRIHLEIHAFYGNEGDKKIQILNVIGRVDEKKKFEKSEAVWFSFKKNGCFEDEFHQKLAKVYWDNKIRRLKAEAEERLTERIPYLFNENQCKSIVLFAHNFGIQEISELLGLTFDTIATYLKLIRYRVGVRNGNFGLLKWARKQGFQWHPILEEI